MSNIGSTKKERTESAMKARKWTAFTLVSLGVLFSSYLASVFLSVFDELMSGRFNNGTSELSFNYFDHALIPLKFAIYKLNLGDVDQSIIEHGLAVSLLSLVFFLIVLFYSLIIFWRTNQIKKFSRDESELGTPESAGSGEHGTSRWQTEKEKNDTTFVWNTSEPLNKAGLIVGTKVDKNGNEIFNLIQGDEHAVMWATTRLGKSRKEVLPLIWTCSKAGESMIINDPKGELYSSASDYLRANGYNVICVNFREPLKGNKWNLMWLVNRYIDKANEQLETINRITQSPEFTNDPSVFQAQLIECSAERESFISKATEVAGDIAHSIAHQSGSKGSSEPIWENGEKSVITALILAVAMESKKDERHMTSVYNLLAEYGAPDEEGDVPLNIFIDSLRVDHPARRAYAVAKLAPEKTRGSFFTQTLTDLRLFADPEISDMTNDMDHDMYKFGVEKTAVFMVVPDDKVNRNVLASIYSDQAYVSSVEIANRYGGRLPIRIRNIYDEFGNMPPIVNFESKITVGGGRGILFVLILQNYSQLESLYDKNADTIIGNCHTWLYLGTHEPKVAKMISEMTGTYTVEADGFNASFSENSTTSVGSSLNLISRPLLTQDEVKKWDKNRIMVFRIGYYPSYYDIGDISIFKANSDYGFKSLAESKALVDKVIEDVGKIYVFFPYLSRKGFEYVSDLASVVRNEYKNYDHFEYALKASQFISIAKWDSYPYRQLKETSLFRLFRERSNQKEPLSNSSDKAVGRNLFGQAITVNVPAASPNAVPSDDDEPEIIEDDSIEDSTGMSEESVTQKETGLGNFLA